MNDKGLFQIARADLRLARLTLTGLNDELALNMAAYHVEQAVEKLLKFSLNLSGVLYPATHNIGVLLDMLTDHRIRYPSWLDDVSYLLSSWSTQTRYNANFSVVRRDVMRMLELSEQWYEEMEASLQGK